MLSNSKNITVMMKVKNQSSWSRSKPLNCLFLLLIMPLCKENELVLEGLSDNLNVRIRYGFTFNPKPPKCN